MCLYRGFGLQRRTSTFLWDHINMADATAAPASSVLLACNKLIARDCAVENDAFLRCKARNRDPVACVKEGEAVYHATLKAYVQSRRERSLTV